jgi:hypothetical protein
MFLKSNFFRNKLIKKKEGTEDLPDRRRTSGEIKDNNKAEVTHEGEKH